MSETIDITPANGAPPAGTTQKDGFASTEIVRQTETASTAVAEQARAAIESRYVMALKRPRSIDEARARLLAACKRPGFAKVARYAKPIGGDKVEGPSIRFAEEALRAMGNVAAEPTVIYDDADKRIVRVSVTDLETNVTHASEVVIEKTVERRFLREGQKALGERVNSQGKKVYIVRATEDDLLNKVNALVSKALRTNVLRIIPGDIVEDAMAQVLKTQADEDAKDPAAARKAIADAFSEIGVMPAQLEQYLGHTLSTVSPSELADLRAIYAAIRDGEASWKDAMEQKASGNVPAGVSPPKRKSESGETKAETPETGAATDDAGPAFTPTGNPDALFVAGITHKLVQQQGSKEPFKLFTITLVREGTGEEIAVQTFNDHIAMDAVGFRHEKRAVAIKTIPGKKGGTDVTKITALEVPAREPGSDEGADQGLPGVE